MKNPHWLVVKILPSQPGDKIDQMRVGVHIRRWHPGWWLILARYYWKAWQRAGQDGKAQPHG